MSRVNKTIPNLQKVWDRLDKAYENMEAAFEMLESMTDIPNELRNEIARFDISAISSLKEHIEIMMEEKSKEITNKNELKIGDVIRFHNWGVGGFLFGLITECEEEPRTHNTTHIWRARSHFSLNNVDAITLIENIKDIKEYELYDFQDFLNDVKENNMKCNLFNLHTK